MKPRPFDYVRADSIDEVLACLANRGAADLPVVMGGIIPDADRTALLNMGIRAVFTPKDSVVGDIVAQIITIAG